MKRFELTFTFLQLPFDYLALVLAGLTAYSLRFSPFITSIRPVIFNLSWQKFWPLTFWVAAGWIIVFAFSGLYLSNPNRKFANEFLRILTACSTSFAAVTIYVFFTLQKFDSRFLVLAGWLLAILFVTTERMLLRALKTIFYHNKIGQRRLVIIGQENIASTIAETLRTKKYLGYNVIAVYPHLDEKTMKAVLKNRADEILFTDPKANESDTLSAVEFANENHITFKYSADLFSTIATNINVSTIAGVPIIEICRARISGWGRIGKRLMDIIISAILLIIFSPFYLIFSLIILIETGRPIVYKNERVGQTGQKFFTLKFRSMYQKFCTGEQFGDSGERALKTEAKLIASHNTKTGPVYKIKDDPRITPFGHFMRRWSIDELPQFWNVFKGDMSLVGPRPHQPREVEKYEKGHRNIFAIKPGLTGLAQISGRSDLSFEDEIRLDTFYMENWNWLLDIIILLKTPFIVVKKKGAW
ncbi:MAG: sugar transferase [bacterium]|nr:sugar transferase [bacterium]